MLFFKTYLVVLTCYRQRRKFKYLKKIYCTIFFHGRCAQIRKVDVNSAHSSITSDIEPTFDNVLYVSLVHVRMIHRLNNYRVYSGRTQRHGSSSVRESIFRRVADNNYECLCLVSEIFYLFLYKAKHFWKNQLVS